MPVYITGDIVTDIAVNYTFILLAKTYFAVMQIFQTKKIYIGITVEPSISRKFNFQVISLQCRNCYTDILITITHYWYW